MRKLVKEKFPHLLRLEYYSHNGVEILEVTFSCFS